MAKSKNYKFIKRKGKKTSDKNKSKRLSRKKTRRTIKKKHSYISGSKKIRLSRHDRVPRLVTEKASTIKFGKHVDSDDDINKLLLEAHNILEKNKRVILSIVWPSYSYPDGPKGAPHQGHTLGISIDTVNSTLIVYDNHQNHLYTSDGDETANYKKIINNIKDHFGIKNLLFFRDLEWCKRSKKGKKNIDNYSEQFKNEHTVGQGTNEGKCQAHACALENLKLIRKLSDYTEEERVKYLVDEDNNAYTSDKKDGLASDGKSESKQ